MDQDTGTYAVVTRCSVGVAIFRIHHGVDLDEK